MIRDCAIDSAPTVLVAEGDPLVRRTTARLLGLLGYHAAEAEDGPDALRLLTEQADVALLLTDAHELVHLAHELRPGSPAVLTDGFAGADALAGLPPGTVCLSKPYGGTDLARALRQVLDA